MALSQSQASVISSQSQTSSRPTCPRCGSRRWRRDPNRGVVVCPEGHVLEGYIRESTEQTETTQHATRKRRYHKSPSQRKSYTLKTAYCGQQARVTLLQALTFLLRRQIEALIQIINAPVELEETARSLWQAYLSTLSLDADLENQSRASSPATSSRCGVEQYSGYSSDEPTGPNSHQGSRFRSSSLSSQTNEDNCMELTPEELKAMTDDESSSSEASASASSTSDSDLLQDELEDSSARPRVYRSMADIRAYPRMEFTICTLYLACIQLRLPIILQDLIIMITTKQLPYIGFSETLPRHVKGFMNLTVLGVLGRDIPPTLFPQKHGVGLFYFCQHLTCTLQELHPPILMLESTCPNLALLVARFSKILLLPTSLQALSLHLVQQLAPPCLTLSSASLSPRKAGRPGVSEQRLQYPPEWNVMATVFATVQYALVSHKSTDVGEDVEDDLLQWVRKTLPEPTSWVNALKHSIQLDRSRNTQKLWEKDIVCMSGAEIDEYVNFAENFLLKDAPEPQDPPLQNRLFPLVRPEECQGSQPLPINALENHGPVRDYSAVAVDEQRDAATAMPQLISTLRMRASSVVGAKEEQLIKLVGQITRKLEFALQRTKS